MKRVTEAGFEIWLVGGCVRDLYLGRKPEDFDLAASSVPEVTASLFENAVMTGSRHGTVIVTHRGMSVDITTFRSEGRYSDSRRPDTVQFLSDIKQDLSRRDFTVNSMAWRPQSGLLDLYGGLDDLRSGLLRSVGDPDERFREDALRMLRAIRFAVQLDLKPDSELLAAACRHHSSIVTLSRERIWREIKLILLAPYAQRAYCFAGKKILATSVSVLLGAHFSDEELSSCFRRIIAPDWPREILAALLWLTANMTQSSDDWMAEISALRSSSEKRQLITSFMKKCRLSRHQAGKSAAALYWCSLRLSFTGKITPYRQRILLRLLAHRFRLDSWNSLFVARDAALMLEKFIARTGLADIGLPEDIMMLRDIETPVFSVAELQISGKDLQKAGITTGNDIQICLERLLSLVIKTPEMNRRDLLENMISDYTRTEHWRHISDC